MWCHAKNVELAHLSMTWETKKSACSTSLICGWKFLQKDLLNNQPQCSARKYCGLGSVQIHEMTRWRAFLIHIVKGVAMASVGDGKSSWGYPIKGELKRFFYRLKVFIGPKLRQVSKGNQRWANNSVFEYYSNNIRIPKYSYSYSVDIFKPNNIRIRIRVIFSNRIIFVFVFGWFFQTE